MIKSNDGVIIQEQLVQLFRKWKIAHINDNELCKTCPKGMDRDSKFIKSFLADGCVDYKKYEKSKYKVLFILKEPGCLREEFFISDDDPSEQMNSHWFKKDIVEKGSENGGVNFKYYKKFKIMADLLHIELDEVAFMNINKRGGYSQGTNDAKLKNYTTKFKDYIVKEIEILNPDLIISCIGKGKAKNIIFDIESWFSTNIGVKNERSLYIGLFKGKTKVIGMEHPGTTLGYEKYEMLFAQALKNSFSN